MASTPDMLAQLNGFVLCIPLACRGQLSLTLLPAVRVSAQMLIGLCGAEMVGPQTVGASEGFLGWVAYLGAANAGIPLSIIVKQFGWDAYFGTLIVACGLAVLLLSPMTRLRSFVQREAVKAKRAE
eukprot:354857-Chlamydomonas_euryale.AAC.22